MTCLLRKRFAGVKLTAGMFHKMSVCYFLGDDFIYGVRYNSDITTDIRFPVGPRYYSGCTVSYVGDTVSLISPHRSQSALRKNLLSGSMFLLENDGKSSMFARLRGTLFYDVVAEGNGKFVYKAKDTKFTPEQVFKAIIGEISKAITGNIRLYNAFFIIPDYYDQSKRCAISECLKSSFRNSNIHLVNYSTAVGMRLYEDVNHDFYCLSIRFDSGPFEVSILKVTAEGATPLASISNDNVTGSDLVTEIQNFLEREAQKMKLKTEYQLEPTPEKQAYGRAAYWRLLRNFAYDTNIEVDLDLDDRNSINPEPQTIVEAFNQLAGEMKLTIANCCILAGVELAKISEAVVTGPFLDTISFEPLLREMGYTEHVATMRENDLCKKVVMRGRCIQVLQSTFSVSLNKQSMMIMDRFTPYPVKKRSQLIVDVEKPEMAYTLLVYQNRIGDRNNRLIHDFTLNNVAVYQGKISLSITLDVDDSGIASLSVVEMSENAVLVNATRL